MAISIECTRSGELAFLDLEGELDEQGAADLKTRALGLVVTGCNEISLNLERVARVSTEACDAMVRIEAMLPGPKSALDIIGPSLEVRRQLEEFGLGEFVKGARNLDYADQMFGLGLVSAGS
ncbi:MAG: STAS domain-containing protein [Actinomycetota bacterium]